MRSLREQSCMSKQKKWPMEGRNCGELIHGRKEPPALHRGGSPSGGVGSEREGERERVWGRVGKEWKHTQRTVQENCSPKPLTGKKKRVWILPVFYKQQSTESEVLESVHSQGCAWQCSSREAGWATGAGRAVWGSPGLQSEKWFSLLGVHLVEVILFLVFWI